MKYVKSAVLLLGLLLLQTTILKFTLGDFAPNLILAAAVCFGIRENNYLHSAIFGAVCGILLDYTSGSLFGVATLLCCVCSALITMVGPRVFKAKFAATLLFLLLTSLVYEFFYYVLCYGLWQQSDYWQVLITSVLPSAILCAVSGVLLMPAMRHIAEQFVVQK